MKVTPLRDQLLARAIMEKYSANAAQDINNVATVSKYAIAHIRAHAGPEGRITDAFTSPPVPSEFTPGWWLDKADSPFPYPRDTPSSHSRLMKQLKSWGPSALIG